MIPGPEHRSGAEFGCLAVTFEPPRHRDPLRVVAAKPRKPTPDRLQPIHDAPRGQPLRADHIAGEQKPADAHHPGPADQQRPEGGPPVR